MAYSKDGYPIEHASKIGHLKLINHPLVTNLISQFEKPELPPTTSYPPKTGTVIMDPDKCLERIVTIDGGQVVVPNKYRPEKQVSFIQVAAFMLKMSDLNYIRSHPMLDPREFTKFTSNYWYHPVVLPLAGIRMPRMSLKETIRSLIDAVLVQTGLYETLKFLVYREWRDSYDIPPDQQPHMSCWECGEEFSLPRHAMSMRCPHCGHEHRLADYLRIGADSADTWTKEEAASNLRDVLETLTLFHYLRVFHGKKAMTSTLFIKDGPLLLRAQLSRLVEPIRDFISYIKDQGWPIYLVGVEKTGELVNFSEEYKVNLPEVGDYFLPSVKFLIEEVHGASMPKNYRNRVSYGAKVLLRAGPNHVLTLNIPTGDFKLDPQPSDLIGFEHIASTLSQLLSYQYPNALIPIVLANAAVSIARSPSGRILENFIHKVLGGES